MLFNAVTCVWNEEDIIESSVRNAFAQGCDNVFVVDNGSTDATVKNALKAGARLAMSFESREFNEHEKICRLNAVVKYQNSLVNGRDVWWMFFDADEFMHVRGERRIRDFLEKIQHTNVCALQGYMHDHIPTHPPYAVAGLHPIDFMPLCTVAKTTKTPILRYRPDRSHFFCGGGAHDFSTNGETVFVADNCIEIHHFQIRDPKNTFSRLKRLIPRLEWMDKRTKVIYKKDRSMYHGRYENLQKTYNTNRNRCLKTYDLGYDYTNILRWYDDLQEIQFSQLNHVDRVFCSAIYNFFMERYDLALCRFNDLLSMNMPEDIQEWIFVKLAECFLHSDPEAGMTLLQSAQKTQNSEIKTYIETLLNGTRPAKAPHERIKIIPYTTANMRNIVPLLRKIERLYHHLHKSGGVLRH